MSSIILPKKDPRYFSNDLKNVLDIITTKRGVYPVGSFAYKYPHKYPSDIDIFERIEYCCDIDDIKQRLVLKFKEMAKEIMKENEVFLSDFKAGYDKRFLYLKDPKLENILSAITNSKLLYSDEKKDLLKLLKEEQQEDYKEYIRQLYTIRWSLEDIVKGYKKLRKGGVKKLSEALTDGSEVKIDLIGKIDGDFKEITNFFYISWKDRDNKKRFLTKKLKDRVQSLQDDIKTYGNKKTRNSLKFAKRLWLLSLIQKNNEVVELLNPLFSSDAAIMNQVSSEAETLIILIDKLKKFKQVKEDVKSQIDEFKSRLSYVKEDLENVYKYLNDITDKNEDEDNIVKNLNKIINILKEKTEVVSSKYLKSVKIKYKQNTIIPNKFSGFFKKFRFL